MWVTWLSARFSSFSMRSTTRARFATISPMSSSSEAICSVSLSSRSR